MKSRNELGGGRRNCSWKSDVRRLVHVCWLLAASTVFALLLVSVHHGLMAKFGKNVDVGPLDMSTMAFGLPHCMQCNSYVSKFPVKIRKRRGEDEILLQRKFLADDEKFMYYAPHSGFNNQVMELKNALMFAKILNRTLIVPPVLDHHAAWLGSCPKRRVLRPHRLRALVWTRIFDLITNSRYTSIADIVDISSITPSKVKTVDLRIFLALWCGVDIRASCGGTLCEEFAKQVFVWREYETCIQLLNPLLPAEQNCCVYSVDNDCTSTIWTNAPTFLNHTAFAADELHEESTQRSSNVVLVDKIESHKLQNVRRRILSAGRMSNEWKTEKAKTSEIKILNIRSSLGPNSPARNSSILAFGSMFSTSYKGVQSHIHIRTPSGNKDLDVLIHSLKSLPFPSDIVAAGKTYIREEIAQPFYCAQLRLLDGQFKNHWNATFKNLKAQLTSYNSAHWSSNPTSVFVMTDLPYENWTQTDLKELLDSKNSYKMHKIDTRKDLIQMASRRVLTGEAGFLVGSNPDVMRGLRQHQVQQSILDKIPHVQLALEEIVCSCARLGFSGTHGSTIADSITNLRSTNIRIGLSLGLSPGFK